VPNPDVPRNRSIARAEGNRRIILLIAVIIALASAWLTWRIPAGSSASSASASYLLLVSGLVSAIVASLNARRFTADRAGWLLIGGGSLVWSAGHILRSPAGSVETLAYTAIFLVAAICLVIGCFKLAGVARHPDARRHIALNLLPPIIALVTATWLIDIGPFLQGPELPWYLEIAAIVHGVAAVVLIVVGLAGVVSWQELRAHPAAQSLMVGLMVIAVADGLWLQQWIDRSPTFGLVADVAFCIGFVTLAIAGLQSRLIMPAHDVLPPQVVAPRLGRHSAPISLILLLALAGGQARWGELVDHGIELTAFAGLAVALFAMMWEDAVLERELVLTDEIDSLSERIDGLISQVGRDPLTGLLNRRAFQDRLEHELAAGRAAAHPVAIALIDVDNFKTVNDTLGHAVGDQLLQAVASVLVGACRASDVAARYAGDEFILIFPGVEETQVGQVSQRIVESVRLINEQLSAAVGVSVTLSVGVATTHKCKRSVAQLVAIADAAMYDAKEAGKDRVVAVDADTLVATAYWGAEPAYSSSATAWSAVAERRGGRSLRSTG
jgi:diguanylate cyclase (GGDEF)-like protein